MSEASAVAEWRWRPRDGERFNFYSHAGGLLASLAAAFWMLSWVWDTANLGVRLAVLVYLGTLVGSFAASSALHFFPAERTAWQRLDHSMIFALIAGTCTPFVVATASDAPWPWLMLSSLWVIAAFNIGRQWRRRAAVTVPGVGSYAAMSCLAVVGAAALVAELNDEAFAWLLTGAMLYGTGILFYRNPWGLRHAHGTWHLLVMVGAAAHYISIYRLLDPLAGI
jgi:hemolysin III